jgi:hypothetical protein
MKTMTFTAVMAVLVVIPFVLWKRRPQLVPLKSKTEFDTKKDEALRYAIDDFLT